MSNDSERGRIVINIILCYNTKSERGDTVARMLMVSSSAPLCNRVKELIPEEHEFLICSVASEMSDALRSLQPDLLIMDLDIAGMDSLFLLENARNVGLTFKLLAFGGILPDYVAQRLEMIGIAHFMLKPCNSQQLAIRAVSICLETQEDLITPNLVRVELALMHLGFYQHLNGYQALAYGVYAYWKNPFQAFTKDLYLDIAQHCCCSWKNVEHAMRSCIAKAYARRDDSVWRMYFPAGKDGKVGHLTTAAFIAALAGHLRRSALQQQERRKAE